MKKGFWATILALCMVLGMLPGTAWAAEFEKDKLPSMDVPSEEEGTWEGWEEPVEPVESAEPEDLAEPVALADEARSGTCGKNVTWLLDGEGTLTISGTGKMNDYNRVDNNWNPIPSPWNKNLEIKNIVISEGVTNVGHRAFVNCQKLKSVILPNSMTSIGAEAFLGCTGLTNITLPSNITNIGGQAFCKCSSLKSIEIPNGVTDIGNLTFGDCTSLTDIIIPNSVTLIRGGAFYGCSSLTNIIIPDSVSNIEHQAFYGCSSLKNIEIPHGITNIEESLFTGCSSLTSVTLPNTVNSIGEYVFSGCSSLKSLVVPEHVVKIESATFEACSSLTDITLPNGLTTIEDFAFAGCSSLTSIILPDTLTSLGIRDTFHGCSSLISLAIPEGVTFIGDCAFANCSSLENLYIPTSVTATGGLIFSGCDNLKNIYYAGNEDEWKHIYFFPSTAFPANLSIHYNSTGPDQPDQPDKPKGDITFAKTPPYTLKAGEEISVTAYIPDTEELQKEDVTWNIDDKAIATIDRETVLNVSNTFTAVITIKGISEGSTRLSISTADGRTNSCQIIVKPNVQEPTFNLSTYRADKLLDASTPMAEDLHNALTFETPCEIMIPLLQENGFETGVVAWEGLKLGFDMVDKPSSVPDFRVEQKDIYSAIILNMLEEMTNSTTSEDFNVPKMLNTLNKDVKPWVSEIASILEIKYNISIDNANDWANLTPEQRKKLNEVSEAFFKDKNPFYYANKAFKALGNVMDVANDLETYVELAASTSMLINLTDSLKGVLLEMERRCPSSNLYLKAALKDCAVIIDNSTNNLIYEIGSKGIKVVGAGNILFDKLWDEVKKELGHFPALDIIMAGYKGGKLISNLLFKTDDTSEKYCIMLATIDIKDLVVDTYKTLEQVYLSNRTAENAETYLSSIDMLFMTLNQDCVAAYNFVDTLDDGLFSKVQEAFKTSGNQRDNLKKSIQNIQKEYKVLHHSAMTGWIHYLDEDYPGSGLEGKYYNIIFETEILPVAKKHSIACPVDVYVYNTSDELVANIINNRPHCNGNLTVAVTGDVKELYFYDDANYNIKYVGNDRGSMDLTITEYGENENALRDVYFFDVPLTDGYQYEMTTDGRTLGDVTYQLVDQNNGNSDCDLDTYRPKETKHTVNIISGSIIKQNELLFKTEVYPDEQLDIYAYIPDGAEFIGWISDAGVGIFEDAKSPVTKVRIPNSDVTLTAVIKNTASNPSNLGDLNGDGKVTMADVIRLARGAAGYVTLTKQEQTAGDVNGDGKITMADVIRVARFAAGYSTTL